MITDCLLMRAFFAWLCIVDTNARARLMRVTQRYKLLSGALNQHPQQQNVIYQIPPKWLKFVVVVVFRCWLFVRMELEYWKDHTYFHCIVSVRSWHAIGRSLKKHPNLAEIHDLHCVSCTVYHSLLISARQLATRESCIAIESHISIKFRLPLCVFVLCVLFRFAAGLINQASVERCFFGRGYRCKCYCYLTDSDKRPGNFPSNWSLCLCV